ncbi:MAG: hypothetical protein KA603_03255 [Azonexus sp.]|jgi:hypothetical protein|nr:hypothetical protein [Betaproteobacteria bacterium]MBK8917373.1 hypothetical protein [Betaproteobacteria bacterium]MBP6035135.1 hypothetical protein [Azonexus sp.]MBP6905887.1 hypothetical protein [Azonexus sp.]
MQAGKSTLAALCAVLLLTGCINDGATYQIDATGQHNLSLVREQTYLWDKKVKFYLVVARMPTCMRRHLIGEFFPKTKVEIFRVPSGAYVVRAGKIMYATETQTCEGFAPIRDEPEEGIGELVGTFSEKAGTPVFEAAEPEAAKSR